MASSARAQYFFVSLELASSVSYASQKRPFDPIDSNPTPSRSVYAPLTVKSSAPIITGLPSTFALPLMKLLGVQSMISPSALYSILPARVPCSRKVPGSIRARRTK